MSRYPESESNNLEFKEKMPECHHFLREVIALCNTFGGHLGDYRPERAGGYPTLSVESASL